MQFRNWATGVLTEYMKKGFALNDARLKNPKQFSDDYFDELLARIRVLFFNFADSPLNRHDFAAGDGSFLFQFPEDVFKIDSPS